MTRGGSRPGSGRNPITGKELKIKVPNQMIEQLNLFFQVKPLRSASESA